MRLAHVVAVVLFVCLAGRALALDTIYLIRHAEKEEGWPRVRELSSMHPLSAAGVERSIHWAAFFRDRLGDGGLAAVYTSPTTRTAHTGLATANRLGAELVASAATITKDEMPAFFAQLRATHAEDKAILIVGHSNTVPLLLRALGAGEECDESLGISEHSYGPGIEGNAGIWTVDLTSEGCEAFTREEMDWTP